MGTARTQVITKFQFHKVQLKAQYSTCNGYNNLFQFHKVQLKAEPAGVGCPVHQFQFHKVQLKV